MNKEDSRFTDFTPLRSGHKRVMCSQDFVRAERNVEDEVET